MTCILIDLVGDTTGDKNDRPLIVVLVTEDHTQIKCNSQVECSIENETPYGSRLLLVILI